MMRRRARSGLTRLVTALFACWLCWGGPAAACVRLLDVSGSMRGFTGTGRLADLVAALGPDCTLLAFGTSVTAVPRLPGPETFAQDTDLAGALVDPRVRESPTVVMLTDNIADIRGSRGKAQDKFYSILRDPAAGFTRIDLLLVRLPFDGKVYRADGAPGKRFRGPRALTIYVLGRGADDRAADRVDRAVRAAGFTAERVRLVPFRAGGDDRVKVGFVSGRNADFDDATASIVLRSRSANDHVRFDLSVDAALSASWDFGNAAIDAAAVFAGDRDFGPPERLPCAVTPAVLAKGQRRATLTVACDLPPPVLSPAQRERLKGLDRPPRRGRLEIAVKSLGGAPALGGLLQTWSFDGDGRRLGDDDAAVQGAVWHLAPLLHGILGRDAASASVIAVPIEDHLFLSDLSILPRLLPFVLAAAAVAGLWLASRRMGRIAVTGADTPAELSPFGTVRLSFGSIAVTFVSLGFGVLAIGRGVRISPVFILGRSGEFVMGTTRRAVLRPVAGSVARPAGADRRGRAAGRRSGRRG